MQQIKEYLSKFPDIKKLFFFLALSIPFLLVSYKVLNGEISFWYDNARDLLSAWNNLSDPTLIGPTSGIPGIFYGPYWIWLLSFPLIISKDPRFVAFVVGIIPYFILFPILLFQFRKMFSITSLIVLWLLFSTSFGFTYAHNLWNPRIAPVLTLLLIFLLLQVTSKKLTTKLSFLMLLFSGFVSGIIINVHISFGIGIFIGSILFLGLDTLFTKQKLPQRLLKIMQSVVSFVTGTIVAFLPFILFELRHNFSQSTTAFHALSRFGDVVTIKGLSKIEILQEFLKSIKLLFHLPLTAAWNLPIFIGIVVVLLYFGYILEIQKYNLSLERKKLLILLFSLLSTIFALYFSARNPIWDYHFIGVEIIFLLFFALLLDIVPFLKKFLLIWCVVILISITNTFVKEAYKEPFTVPNLRTKTHITGIVGNDAAEKDYTVVSYHPSIYQYEYTYLFKWRYGKDVAYDPGQIPLDSSLVYLILPGDNQKNESLTNFVEYRTPEKLYITEKTWNIPDGSTILKRVKK